MEPCDAPANNNGKSHGATRSPFYSYGELGYQIPRGSHKFSNNPHNNGVAGQPDGKTLTFKIHAV